MRFRASWLLMTLAVALSGHFTIAKAQDSPGATRGGGRFSALTNEDRQFLQTLPREIRSIVESRRLDGFSCTLNCHEYGSHLISDVDILSDLLFEHQELIINPLKEYFTDAVKKVDLDVTNVTQFDPSKKKPLPDPLPPGEVPVWVNVTRPTPTELRWEMSANNIRFLPDTPLPDAAAQIRKLKRQIEMNVAKALPDFAKEYYTKHLADRAAMLERSLAHENTEVADAQNKLAASSGMPSEKFSEQLAEISRQQIAAKLSLVGMDARLKAITQELNNTQAKMQEKTDSDDTLKNLEKLLQLRTQRLDDLKKMHDSGIAQSTDVQTAEADLLSAKIELDKTRAALKRANGGEQLEAFNNELSRLAIDRAEAEARLNFLLQTSAETEHELRARRDAEKLAEEAQPKLAAAKKQIDDLSVQLEQTKKAQEDIQPLRVVLPDEPADNSQPTSPTGAAPSSENSKSDKHGS